jgi:hypothetical protein
MWLWREFWESIRGPNERDRITARSLRQHPYYSWEVPLIAAIAFVLVIGAAINGSWGIAAAALVIFAICAVIEIRYLRLPVRSDAERSDRS